MRIDLPPAVEEALGKGVPIFFVAEAEVFRDRWYWSDKRVALATRTWRIAFQPLTRRWRLNVTTGPASLTQSFESLAEALATMARIPRWRVLDSPDVDADGRYTVELKFRLDTTQLPRPFQIGLLGQPEWTIGASRSARVNMSAPSDAQR